MRDCSLLKISWFSRPGVPSDLTLACLSRLLRPLLYVILTTFYIFVSVSLTRAQGSEPLEERFFTEGPQKWEEYCSLVKRVQGTVLTTFTKRNAKGDILSRIRTRKEIKQNERCALFLYQAFEGEKLAVDDERTEGGCYVVNPQYAFELSRSDSKHEWILARLDPKGEGASFRDGPVRKIPLDWIAAHLDVYGQPLSSLIKNKDFKITKTARINRGSQILFQVHFEYPHFVSSKVYTYPVQSGSLLLDPDHFWVLHEFEVQCKYSTGTGTVHEMFSFKEDTNGLPLPTRMHRTVKATVTEIVGDELFEYDLHNATKLPPDEEFTLSAFGLPEPMGVKLNQPPRTWLWLLAAAVATATLAILFSWLKRRRTTAVRVNGPTLSNRRAL
jgi:hypothetical protein